MMKSTDSFFTTKKPWSEIKDRLLEAYLVPYFQKILTNKKPITYIDCFAGKGMFDDGTSGSPIIALNVRDKCLDKSRVENHCFNTIFIEPKYYIDLKENIRPYSRNNCSICVIEGKYEEKINELLSKCQNHNVFLYLDPYGIKPIDSTQFKDFSSLKHASFEMLINFNSFGFFREACRVKNINCDLDPAFQNKECIEEYEEILDNASDPYVVLNRIIGGDYWISIVEDYRQENIDGYDAENRLSKEYWDYLKLHFKYVLNIPIRPNPSFRPKYRMYHLSNHQDGCYLMATNMLKRIKELFREIQQNGSPTLFDRHPDFIQSTENKWLTVDSIKETVRSFAKKYTYQAPIKEFFAEFFSECGLICEIKLLREILTEMSHNGELEILRIPHQTMYGKPTTFWTTSKKNQIFIKSLLH